MLVVEWNDGLGIIQRKIELFGELLGEIIASVLLDVLHVRLHRRFCFVVLIELQQRNFDLMHIIGFGYDSRTLLLCRLL